MSGRTCTVEGCDLSHLARGYCATHYKRIIRNQPSKESLRAAQEVADAARLEDLMWMLETGESLIGAAKRLGLSERGLELWLTRRGAQDLTAKLRSRNPRDPNASANKEAVWVKPAKARHRARKRVVA